MIALTMGDPAGIGGELTLAAWHALRDTGPAFVAINDAANLKPSPPGRGLGEGYHKSRPCPSQTQQHSIQVVASAAEAAAVFPHSLPVLQQDIATTPIPGHPDPSNSPAVIASIERAVQLAMSNEASAVVTNPVSKAALYAAGFPHPGHTEFLGALTGCNHPVMMLANDFLRVVPVTVHVGLRAALDSLTTEAIVATSRIAAAALRSQFGIAHPRLVIAGLNPHAGEGGAMGDEEALLIAPAIAALRAEGIDVTGPHPPDTMFTAAARGGYDVAICMYHDQALIPLKTLDMASGVNVTLGLPIIRTSPDHGTAFDIAGQGRADPASLIAALRLAATLAARRTA